MRSSKSTDDSYDAGRFVWIETVYCCEWSVTRSTKEDKQGCYYMHGTVRQFHSNKSGWVWFLMLYHRWRLVGLNICPALTQCYRLESACSKNYTHLLSETLKPRRSGWTISSNWNTVAVFCRLFYSKLWFHWILRRHFYASCCSNETEVGPSGKLLRTWSKN